MTPRNHNTSAASANDTKVNHSKVIDIIESEVTEIVACTVISVNEIEVKQCDMPNKNALSTSRLIKSIK